MSKWGSTNFTWPGGTVYKSRVFGANPVDIEAETPTVAFYKEGVKKVGIPSFEPWDRCFQCGFTYPRSKFQYYQNKPYCIQGGCFRDIAQLRRKNRGKDYRRLP